MGLKMLVFGVCVLGLAACAKEPESYDECILINLKEGMNEFVARSIVHACRKRFDKVEEAKNAIVKIPEEVKEKIKGRFKVTAIGGSGSIYNGDDSWQIEALTIVIIEKDWKGKLVEVPEASSKLSFDNLAAAKIDFERYRLKISIPPLSSKDFTLDVHWRESEGNIWVLRDVEGYDTSSTTISSEKVEQ